MPKLRHRATRDTILIAILRYLLLRRARGEAAATHRTRRRGIIIAPAGEEREREKMESGMRGRECVVRYDAQGAYSRFGARAPEKYALAYNFAQYRIPPRPQYGRISRDRVRSFRDAVCGSGYGNVGSERPFETAELYPRFIYERALVSIRAARCEVKRDGANGCLPPPLLVCFIARNAKRINARDVSEENRGAKSYVYLRNFSLLSLLHRFFAARCDDSWKNSPAKRSVIKIAATIRHFFHRRSVSTNRTRRIAIAFVLAS